MKSKQDVSTKLLSFWRVTISLGAIVGGLDTMKTALIHKHIFNLDEKVTQIYTLTQYIKRHRLRGHFG